MMSWQEAINLSHPKAVITSQCKAEISTQSRWLRGTVRYAMGKLVTEDEYVRRRDRLNGK